MPPTEHERRSATSPPSPLAATPTAGAKQATSARARWRRKNSIEHSASIRRAAVVRVPCDRPTGRPLAHNTLNRSHPVSAPVTAAKDDQTRL